MKKIYLLLVLIAGFAFKPVKAQVDTAALINAYLSSDNVFEGVVQSTCSYTDNAGYVYTSNQVLITKIIKGNLQCGTVDIITPGGVANGYGVSVSDQTEFNAGSAGVFLCINNVDYPVPSCDNPSNQQPLALTIAFQGTIEYYFDYVNAEVVGFNMQFPTIQSFYDYLRDELHLQIIDCNGSIIQQMRKAAYAKKEVKEKIIERIATTSEGRIVPKNKEYLLTKNLNNSTLKKTGESIEFLISNVSLNTTSGCNKEYVVEISVKSNVNTTYLLGAVFRLKYNEQALGTNIRSGITFTRSSDFPASTYDYLDGYDFTNSIVQISMQSFVSSPTFTQVTTNPKKLFSIHIPVVNCKELGNFKIDTFPQNGITWYSLTPTTIDYITYDNKIYGATNSGSTCNPIISSLSTNSSTLHGGKSDVLTITGCDFGNTKGKVSMNDADGKLYPTKIALDGSDIIYWSNTLIQTKIPSLIDSSEVYVHPVGTGTVVVSDAYGNNIESTQPINVLYSLCNVRNDNHAKVNRYLFSSNTDGKYHFKLYSNVTDQGMIDCINAAFRRWRCTTGVPFFLDPGFITTTPFPSYPLSEDGVNLILMKSISTDFNAQTSKYLPGSSCSNNSSQPDASPEYDIAINSNNVSDFYYDTTGNYNLPSNKTDFFRTILHELGHCLELMHTLNHSDIMYYEGDLGYIAAANRTIYIKNNDLAGADFVVNNSLSTPTGMTCSYNLPIIKQTAPCSWNNAVNEINNKEKYLQIYPNPFTDIIFLKYFSQEKATGIISIYDYTGKQVYSKSGLVFSTGNNELELKDLHLNNGVYFINVTSGNTTLNYKIVCVH